MSVSEPLDLRHGGRERAIACYLVETSEGPALFDCGPATCVDTLKERLREHDLTLGDIRHLLLSHIHLDHAGAAGVLVREHPGLRVHVSAVGAPHLVDPARLEASARRLYGDAFDGLWGEVAAVPEENLEVAADEVVGLPCFPSPGHASHHLCYVADDGTLLAGDAAGVRIQPSPYVLPPCPPPDVDVEAWHRTIDEIERHAPARLALIHFGHADDVGRHLDDLRRRLDAWSAIVGRGASQDEFLAEVVTELADAPAAEADVVQAAMPLEQTYAGLKRYWDRRA